jgi:tRNA (guanine37-N1)-methyltransferase
MQIDVLTLFPGMIEAVLGESIIGRARDGGLVSIRAINIRDYSENKHRRVDDTPYGGGRGMLMAAPPIYNCYQAAVADAPADEKRHVVYLSPRGRTFTQKIAKEYLQYDRLVLLCGHYEGIDQRVIDEIVDEELSVGDYVLTGGELPACIVADAVGRMVPGVLAESASFEEESHYSGLLESPQYTRPEVWHDMPVPEVLLSGHHGNVEKWRRKKSLELTRDRRPDLFEKIELSKQDKKLLESDELK